MSPPSGAGTESSMAIKMTNLDIKSAAERRLIQLIEYLDEIRYHVYENSWLYKEKEQKL